MIKAYGEDIDTSKYHGHGPAGDDFQFKMHGAGGYNIQSSGGDYYQYKGYELGACGGPEDSWDTGAVTVQNEGIEAVCDYQKYEGYGAAGDLQQCQGYGAAGGYYKYQYPGAGGYQDKFREY